MPTYGGVWVRGSHQGVCGSEGRFLILPYGGVLVSNGNDIETKAEQSFDLDFGFYIEAKLTCLFQKL